MANLVEDNVGGGFPDEVLGHIVPGGEPRINGPFQFFERVEGASPDHLVGDEAEPPFDLIKPGTAGGREVEVETAASLWLEPVLDAGAFVGAAVIEDQMNVEIGRLLLFQLVEELDELFAAMARQATADDLAIQNIEGCKQGRRSVPFIVMRLALRYSRSQRKNRSGPV